MRKFTITLAREVTENLTIEVDAEHLGAACVAAMDQADRAGDPEWEDAGSTGRIYVDDAEEL